MNLYQLRYFVMLAETKHFGKAAERLCIAQPSLSHAIAQLEAELGVVLFERKNRSSTLTKEGMQFLSYVEKSLEILDNGIETMAHISRGEGCIELGFLRTLGLSLIPELASGFLQEQKDKHIQFKFYTDVTQPLLQGLKDEKYDMVFCTQLENEKNIEFIPVSKQDLVLIVPRNHPLANRYTVDLTETLPYPHVYFAEKSGLRIVIDRLFEKNRKTSEYCLRDSGGSGNRRAGSAGVWHCRCALHGGAAAAECQNHPDFLPLLGTKFLYGNPQGQISSPCGTKI